MTTRLLIIWATILLLTLLSATAHAVDLMAEGRGFTAFEPFTNILLDLYDAREPGQTIADLYPALLDWARAHQKPNQDTMPPETLQFFLSQL
jgi:hypothetical protein